MTHLLDTDHVSILERRGGSDYAVLIAHLNLHAESDIGVSIISFHEQSRGCNNLVAQARSPAELVRGYDLFCRVIEDFRNFPLVPFDLAAAAMFDGLRAQKVRISTMDLRFAAVALSRNLVLVTRNVSDFGKVPGLRTADWTK
jgi:tRNA(fMet)-specific endonuclease VapC